MSNELHTDSNVILHKENNDNPELTNDNLELTNDNSELNDDNLQSTIDNLQLTIDNSQSTIDNLQSTIDNLQSTIDNSQLTIDNSQLTIDNSQLANDSIDDLIVDGDPYDFSQMPNFVKVNFSDEIILQSQKYDIQYEELKKKVSGFDQFKIESDTKCVFIKGEEILEEFSWKFIAVYEVHDDRIYWIWGNTIFDEAERVKTDLPEKNFAFSDKEGTSMILAKIMNAVKADYIYQHQNGNRFAVFTLNNI